jgi:hypothetical protein
MSGRLRTEDRLAQPDDLYQLLVDAHHGLSSEQSRRLDARLILLLANHAGDLEAIREAVAIARRGVIEAQQP